MNRQNCYKIISVGGSIIIPREGFNIHFLKKFRSLILDRVKKGEKFILVIGGGYTCRNYQNSANAVRKITKDELDWLGIYSTWLNAEFVRFIFGGSAYPEVIKNPILKIKNLKSKIIIAAGWKPGWSTDMDAVLLAKTYDAKEILNLSNIEYVYDKDPHKFKNAKKIESISWSKFRSEIVGFSRTAGEHAPFDTVASKEAQKLGLIVKILKGTNLIEVKKALDGKRFKGTIVQ